MKDLKVFKTSDEDLFKEITQLVTLENFRQNEKLAKHGDTKSARTAMLVELKELIEVNPLLRDKLQFPNVENSRLRILINQSLNWQHQLCKNPSPNPDIKTLFCDHSCSQPHGARAPSPAPLLMNTIPKPGGFPPMGLHGAFRPFHQAAAPIPSSVAGWMANTSNVVRPMPHPAVSAAPLGLAVPPNTELMIAPMGLHGPFHQAAAPIASSVAGWMANTTNAVPPMPHPAVSAAPLGLAVPPNTGYPGIARNPYSTEELPKNVAVVLNQGSSVMSMDFHPSQPTVLLVGTDVGDITVWEVSCRERLAHRTFKVWELSTCSMLLQSTLFKDPAISVNRVVWNPDRSQFGVAYSKHLVHLYNYHGGGGFSNHLEIDAHVGGVNDIAFSRPNNKFCVVTCGDDKIIKVWDAITGVVQYTFEGHEAPVYSICPHSKENIQFIFSTSLDGKIKAWLDVNGGSSFVDYTAPGHWCTTMAYSADGTRLFSCGTGKEGDSYIVEWNESEGSVMRSYIGFRRKSTGVVQFDTTKNRFLAAGDEFMVKFWDMDNTNLLTTTDAGGELPASPRVRFSKLGSFLAVSTSDHCIKILANADGFRMLRSLESRSYNTSRLTSEAITKAPSLFPSGTVSAAAGISAAVADRGAPVASIIELPICDWKPVEISEPSQCCSLKLSDNVLPAKVARLSYTNSGTSILALTCNAVHKLWKWQKTDTSVTGKATAMVPPQLWLPKSGILMTNEISDSNPEEAAHCFALSNNDAYVMSTSGGKISIFNMMTFKTMATFTVPSVATFLALHPQDNNIIAIGMDDSSIQINDVKVDEVKSRVRGHQKSITGLAFSNALNVLVSSGADAQLCVWGMDGWEKQASNFLQIPSGRVSCSHAQTRVQFHNDQIHLLVVHEAQLAIYEASKLECLKKWTPREGSITHAAYSCDGQTIYTSFTDASVGVFTSALGLKCRISPTAYLSCQPSPDVYPVVVAAHPSEANQFAVGLTDGSVQVLEPLESEGRWGTDPPPEKNASSSSHPPGKSSSDQRPSR